MIIKSFIAESSAAALKRVREEMGGDAIVLKTRQITGRGRTSKVEVTACIESPTIAQASAIIDSPATESSPVVPSVTETSETDLLAESPTPSEMQLMDSEGNHEPSTVNQSRIIDTKLRPEEERLDLIEQKLDSLLQLTSRLRLHTTLPDYMNDIANALRTSDIPESLIQDLITSDDDTINNSPEDYAIHARNTLAEQLASLVCDGITLQKGDSVVFVGPAGAGKTSVMGKLAAQLVSEQKQKVTLAGLDYQKVAAYEELAVYADLLDIELNSLQDKKSGVKFEADAITLVDTPAMPADIQKQQSFIEAVTKLGATHRVVVFSALTRSSDIVHFAEMYKQVQPTQIVMSMFDQTGAYGSAVTAAKELNIPIAYISDTPGGIGTLKPVDLAVLTPALLNMKREPHEQA